MVLYKKYIYIMKDLAGLLLYKLGGFVELLETLLNSINVTSGVSCLGRGNILDVLSATVTGGE